MSLEKETTHKQPPCSGEERTMAVVSKLFLRATYGINIYFLIMLINAQYLY